MFFVWALALTGLFLIYLEFFLPGAVMAIGGGLLLLGSIFVFCLAKPGFLLLVLYLIALASAVYTLVRFAQWRVRLLKKTDSYHCAGVPKEMIGRVAKTATDLKPSGHIFIDNQEYLALSESGPIEKGIDVVVIGEQELHLIVQIQSGRTEPL